MAKLKDIIKAMPWSSIPVVDIYMFNGYVNVSIDINGALHKRNWKIS